jgi:glucose-6-phosphate dehydrogenase assembly protein OpcA
VSLLAGEPVPVEVEAIERASRDLWTLPDDPAQPVVRAQAATLVVYSSDAERANHAIEEVAVRFPGRSILIESDRGAELPGFEAWIAGRCHPGLGGHVCAEQITLAAAGEPPASLPPLVAALRPTDVPACLWWDAPLPARPQLLRRLADGMARVVVDSGRGGRQTEDGRRRAEDGRRSTEAPHASSVLRLPSSALLLRTLALVRSRRLPPVADLAWTRITPWRELVAQCFDPPEARGLLPQIERIRLRAVGHLGAVEAQLLAGWLAARLGWKPGEGKRKGARGKGGSGGSDLRSSWSLKRPEGGSVVVSLEVDEGGEEGVAGVRLRAGGARFVVERHPEAPCVCVTARSKGGEERSRAVALPRRSEGALLCQELAQAGRDPVLEAALAAAASAW